ncbi:MAG: hypothetical protein AAF668_14395 [Pseudomonadota bacterium]
MTNLKKDSALQRVVFGVTALGCVLANSSPSAANELTPSSELLAPFSRELRDSQPEDAFVAVYKSNDVDLVWVGAKHSTDVNSNTFNLIKSAYDVFDIDLVIVEGCPFAMGINSPRLEKSAREAAAAERDGFQQDGEFVPAIMGALSEKADFACGEPDDDHVKKFVLASRFSAEDLLGFYTLRSIPQWIRERRIDDASDPRINALLEDELIKNKRRLDLPDTFLPSVKEWVNWYTELNEKSLDASFTTEEAGPLIDGPFKSNAIGAAISRARAAFLHELVIEQLSDKSSVLVVYGASHLLIHRPALDATLGPPCYAGDTLTQRVSLDCNAQ